MEDLCQGEKKGEGGGGGDGGVERKGEKQNRDVTTEFQLGRPVPKPTTKKKKRERGKSKKMERGGGGGGRAVSGGIETLTFSVGEICALTTGPWFLYGNFEFLFFPTRGTTFGGGGECCLSMV